MNPGEQNLHWMRIDHGSPGWMYEDVLAVLICKMDAPEASALAPVTPVSALSKYGGSTLP